MRDKLYSIQYLRALAALLVVVAHAWDHSLPAPNMDANRLGMLGVSMFFVISGFIMVVISGEGKFRPVDFLRRRIIRIVPLYWIFTTLAAVLALVAPSLFKTTIFTWPHYLQSLLFIPHEAPGRGGTSPLLSLGWTLNDEAWFYLCFALLAFLAVGRRVTVLTAFFVGLLLLGLLVRPQGGVLAFYTDIAPLAFCAGAWLGWAYLKGMLTRLQGTGTIAMVLIGLAGLCFAEGFNHDLEPGYAAFVGLVVFSAALLLLGLGREATMVPNRLAILIGDASYAIYLLHMFVVGAVVALSQRFVPIDDPFAMIAVIALCTVIATGAGIVVHLLLEVPILNWLRRPRWPSLPRLRLPART